MSPGSESNDRAGSNAGDTWCKQHVLSPKLGYCILQGFSWIMLASFIHSSILKHLPILFYITDNNTEKLIYILYLAV